MNAGIPTRPFWSCDAGVIGQGLGTGDSLNVANIIITGNHADGLQGASALAQLTN